MAAEVAGPAAGGFDARPVEFWSDDFTLQGTLRIPTAAEGPTAGIVFTPGWLGLAEGGATTPWLEAHARAGLTVLSFDYRGFGQSEGPQGQVRPDWQVEDIRNAVTYMATLPEVDPDRIGLFGKGGTGGGNAILAAALDDRVRCTTAMTPVADGAVWLRGMRREYEWREFLRRVTEAEQVRVTQGIDPTVDPRTEIMIAAPERAAAPHKGETDRKVGSEFRFSTAAHILRYRPVDVAHRLAGKPVLLIGIEEDVVAPIHHARALHAAVAANPRRLVVLRDVAHYEADARYFSVASELATQWATRFLRPVAEVVPEDLLIDDILSPAADPAGA